MSDTPEMLDIPAFLRRNADNTLPDIRPDAPATNAPVSDPPARQEALSSDPQPTEAATQPEVRRHKRGRTKEQSYAELTKMKVRKGNTAAKERDRAAARSGKVWDPTKAEWTDG